MSQGPEDRGSRGLVMVRVGMRLHELTLAECDLEKARERCRRLLFKHGVGSRAAAVLFAIARKERAVSLAREALRKAEKELRDSGWKPVIETD